MKRIGGVGAARGYAIGPAVQFHNVDLRVGRKGASDPLYEAKRLDEALSRAETAVAGVIEQARRDLAPDRAAIFEAQLLMLQDPELLSTIRRSIQVGQRERRICRPGGNGTLCSGAGWHARLVLQGPRSRRTRCSAARSRILLNVESSDLSVLGAPAIVLAQDLTPSDTVTMDKRKVLGLCTVEGSETSHTAILARGLGIPAVVGAGAELLEILDGTELILDGTAGEVLVAPASTEREEYERKRREFATHSDYAQAHSHEAAVTLDGRRVDVLANIGSLDGARQARLHGAEGVGLLRTEFLYMDRSSLPSEEEQYEIYMDLFGEFGELPIVLRTCDIGGDKALAYLDLPREPNPFLGMRGTPARAKQTGRTSQATVACCLARREGARPADHVPDGDDRGGDPRGAHRALRVPAGFGQ